MAVLQARRGQRPKSASAGSRFPEGSRPAVPPRRAALQSDRARPNLADYSRKVSPASRTMPAGSAGAVASTERSPAAPCPPPEAKLRSSVDCVPGSPHWRTFSKSSAFSAILARMSEFLRGNAVGTPGRHPARTERATRSLQDDLRTLAGSGGDRSRQAVGIGNQDGSRASGIFHSYRHAESGQQSLLQIRI